MRPTPSIRCERSREYDFYKGLVHYIRITTNGTCLQRTVADKVPSVHFSAPKGDYYERCNVRENQCWKEKT